MNYLAVVNYRMYFQFPSKNLLKSSIKHVQQKKVEQALHESRIWGKPTHFLKQFEQPRI